MFQSRHLILLSILISVLAIVAIGGSISTYESVSSLRHSLKIQSRTAARTECARQVSADTAERFDKDVANLIEAGRNPTIISGIVKDLKKIPNVADQVNKVCPPSAITNH